MAFGFGVGDVIKALELANEIRVRFVDAPAQFEAISDEVTSLSSILDKVNIILPQRDLNDQQELHLNSIIVGCHNVLDELREKLEKYQELGSNFKSCDPKSLRAKIQRGWKRLKWKPEDIRELRSRIHSNVSMFHAFYGEITMKVVLETKSVVDRLNKRQDDQSSRDIINWLSPVNYHTQQDDFLRRRQEGTGKWLLDSDEFQAWLKLSKQTLFCPGIPGAGKTMISSIVIEHLQTKFENRANIGIAYVYCNYRQQQQQKAEDLLSSLLQQLTQQKSSIPGEVERLYEHHRKKQTSPSFNEIAAVLQSTILSYSEAFIIVDAIDECQVSNEVRKKFLSELFNLQANTQVNFFATSRIIPDIQKEFVNKNCISLEIRASEGDMRRYLNGHMSQLPRCVSKDLTLQEHIITEIINAADGMFLLVQLYLDSLIDKTTAKKIKRALENLPRESDALDKSYENAMERIQGQKRGFCEVAKMVLSWIICAKRQLATSELQHALAVEAGDSELDGDNVLEVEEMVSVCAGLVTVDQESDIIRLVHYTTQEYFERTQLHWFPDAQTDIARTCITYLSFNTFETGSCSTDEELEARLRSNILYDYATKNWGHHVCASLAQIDDLILDFLESKAKVSAAAQAIMPYNYRNYQSGSSYSERAQLQFTGIHLAAYHGLENTMLALLSNGHYPDSKDENGQTPLSWAAKRGHNAVVKLLLANNSVNPDSKDINYGRTPLWWAARNGHDTVVKLLLAKDGVDPDSKDKIGRTPLYWASGNGHKVVVKLLLAKNGVDLNSKDIYFNRSPLSWAAKNGHETVVKLLLAEDKVDPDSKDKKGRTPLSWAAENGREAVMKLLLAKDNINPDSKDVDYGRTPLSWAAGNGCKAVVKLLLAENGVDPDSKDIDHGWTPLWWAAKNGHASVLELLLAKDVVNPDSKDEFGRTPLSWAVENGSEAVVRLLLTKDGVDLDSTHIWYGQTPLSWAAKRGYASVAELLLAKAGVNPDSKDKFGRTPLSWAAANGCKAVVRLLLTYDGVEFDSTDIENNQTPLSWAAKYGHAAVVELLLAKDNVNPDSKDRKSRTPLSWAAENGHEGVVRLLLAKDGVDLDSADIWYGQTPLSWAAQRGHATVVELLLAKDDVNPDSKDQKGRTPLWWAARSGHASVVELLLAKDDVNPDSRDKEGRTPLSWAAENGCEGVVRLLLTKGGVNLDSADIWYGQTPLSWASKRGHATVVELLLAKASVNPDSRDKKGQTPLSWAAANGREAVVRLLLAKGGVDPDSKDNNGRTPLFLAARNRHEDVKNLLLAMDGVDPEFHRQGG
ncbi:hypothetical protein MMC31_003421 [Peltigera leucophlebia]|nr:hypothetical protein [Peltigera leucophlebia]